MWSSLWSLFFVACALSWGNPEPTKAPAKTPDTRQNEIVSRLQKAWEAAKSYKSDFKQFVFSKRMGSRDEYAGVIYVVKPSKLRWESTADGSIQIMNAKKLWSITENKRRGNRVVDIYKDIRKSVDNTTLTFLSGKGKFKDLYNIKLLSESDKLAELKLTPKADPNEHFVAEIDKNSYFLRSLTTENADTRVRIDFSNTKINVPLADTLFEFTPDPKDIVHEQ